MNASRVAPLECDGADHRRWVLGGHSLHEPLRLLRLAHLRMREQEPVNVVQTRTGEHALETHVAELAREKFEQLLLLAAAWCEVAMAALGRDRIIAPGRCDHTGLAQSRARRDDCDIRSWAPHL